EEIKKQTDELKALQKKELESKGADTEKITKLATRIDELRIELQFIEKNTPITERYKYDKEQLFDKIEFFKNQKIGFENQLSTEQTKHDIQKQKLIDELNFHKGQIANIQRELENVQEDLNVYEAFKLTDCFRNISEFLNELLGAENRTEKRCKFLIAELNDK